MTATVLGIDPGSTRSGWVLLRGDLLLAAGDQPNEELLDLLLGDWRLDRDHVGPSVPVVIETVESWGGLTRPDALATMRWVGRFEQAAMPREVTLLTRRAVLRVLNLGKTPAGQAQAVVRAYLIDRWGGGNPARKDHPLHGVTGDAWSALALAVAYGA